MPTLPGFRQLLIGAILLAVANAESAQILLVDMGVSAELPAT
jgi:hypothetical protein